MGSNFGSVDVCGDDGFSFIFPKLGTPSVLVPSLSIATSGSWVYSNRCGGESTLGGWLRREEKLDLLT